MPVISSKPISTGASYQNRYTGIFKRNLAVVDICDIRKLVFKAMMQRQEHTYHTT